MTLHCRDICLGGGVHSPNGIVLIWFRVRSIVFSKRRWRMSSGRVGMLQSPEPTEWLSFEPQPRGLA